MKTTILALLFITGCAAEVTPAPSPVPAPAPCATVVELIPIPAPAPVPAGVHLGDPCSDAGSRACDSDRPAICSGVEWIFNTQRCTLPDCWLPSPLAMGGCVEGCYPATGTCIESPQ